MGMAAMITESKEDTLAWYAKLLLEDCINKHNEFVSHLQEGLLNGATAEGLESVPLKLLQQTDMLVYDEMLWEVELKRSATQSLEYGKGSDISFNKNALTAWIRENVLGSHAQVSALIRNFKFAGVEMHGYTGPIGGIAQVIMESEMA